MILDMFIFQDAPARRAENGLHGLLNVGFLAIVIFRLSQVAGKRLPLLGSVVKQINHVLTGADLAWEVSVGANAVVTKSCVRPGAVLVGIPARELSA